MNSYIGGDQYNQGGTNNTFSVTHNRGPADVDAAVRELRQFIGELTRHGVVAPDGSVTDPGAVVRAVEANPGRLRALGTAIAGGARDAVLQVVQGGVAALIVALVGGAA